ncbi:MAG: outer membrane beta-barrel protein [Bacteroidota bacterium]|nr:outer membrane beta-barrel protein [Bacteroidota bacterium]
MKKVLSLLFLGVGLSANAQVGFYPSIRAGANFSKYTSVKAAFKPGIYVGFFGELKLGNLYSLQPEISYSSQGANNVRTYVCNVEHPNGGEIVNVDYEVNYVSVALVHKFRFDEDKVNFHFGGLLDFEVGSCSDAYSRKSSQVVDIGFLLGVGYKITDKLGVEFRYKQGIVDQLNTVLDGTTNANMTLQAGVTYSFR